MEPLALPRRGVGHDGGTAEGFASASHIRELLINGACADEFLTPESAAICARECAAGRAPVTMANAERAILARLRAMREEDFAPFDGGGEEMCIRDRLQPAFAKISEMGIRYSALPCHTVELADALNEALSAKWRDLRGIEVVSFGVSSVTANEEDEKMIKEMQRNAAFMDPTRAAAHLAGATGDAMKTAAANPNGAVGAFMGMGMAGGMTGNQMAGLYQQGAQMQQAAPAAPAAAGWTCACGQTGNTGKFCANCGKPAPVSVNEWTCSCGAKNTGKFCSECGKPAPAGEWTCDCGTKNSGKFCSNCGKPRA